MMRRFILAVTLVFTTLLLSQAAFTATARADEVTFMAVGDVLPHPSWQPFEIPVASLLEGVATTFFEADVVVGNLESPLTDKVKTTAAKSTVSLNAKENFVFKAESESTAEGLRNSGFSVLTLANNHIMDYREEGLLDTLDRLLRADMLTAGAGKDTSQAYEPAVIEARGAEFVILAASDVVPKGYGAEKAKPGIASMKNAKAFVETIKGVRADYPDAVLVLSLHWGVEATYTPTARQKQLARKFIDAGADLILGHHPHRIQGVEIYKDRPIFYSLGNFQFDSKEPGDRSMIAKLLYTPGSRTPDYIGVMPVIIKPGGYPRVLEPDDEVYGEILGKLGEVSGQLGVNLEGEMLVPAPAQDAGYDYWGT